MIFVYRAFVITYIQKQPRICVFLLTIVTIKSLHICIYDPNENFMYLNTHAIVT